MTARGGIRFPLLKHKEVRPKGCCRYQESGCEEMTEKVSASQPLSSVNRVCELPYPLRRSFAADFQTGRALSSENVCF